MHILVSADKFKDCLSAQAVCDGIAAQLRSQLPQATLRLCPLTDGGDGFASVLTTAADGILAGEEVCDPLGRTTQAAFGIVPLHALPQGAAKRLLLPPDLPHDARLAIIEMASASGLQLLAQAERNPWQTDSTGTGQLIRAAQAAGVAAIVLGVGGSATHDLGLGALCVLGYRFLRADGSAITRPCPANWHEIARIDGALDATLPPLRIACDVTNPLLGAQGAAAVYAPQKGLGTGRRAGDGAAADDTDAAHLEAQIAHLEAATERIAALLCKHHGCAPCLTALPGTGAAGGIAFGLLCAAAGSKALRRQRSTCTGAIQPDRDMHNGQHDSTHDPYARLDAHGRKHLCQADSTKSRRVAPGGAGSHSESDSVPQKSQEVPGSGGAVALIGGFDLVRDWLQLDEHLRWADIVITAEGKFDQSSLSGKGPGALAQAALALGKPVHVFAGQVDCPPQPGLHLHRVSPEGMPVEEAMANAPALLRAAVARAGKRIERL